VYSVPHEARWSEIAAKAKSPQIGEIVDKAMIVIEHYNARLRGVLPKEYAKPSLGWARSWTLSTASAWVMRKRGKHDVIGRVYELSMKP
jgi:type I restriction enzyme M protein